MIGEDSVSKKVIDTYELHQGITMSTLIGSLIAYIIVQFLFYVFLQKIWIIYRESCYEQENGAVL